MSLKEKIARRVLDHAQLHETGSGMLVWACGKYLASYKNSDYAMARNGEAGVLSTLSPLNLKTLFDVGANRGEWTRAALTHTGDSFVHAFEIAPTVAEALRTCFEGEPRVRVNPFGLSDKPGSVEIDFVLNGGHTGTTMLTDQRVLTKRRVERQVGRVEVGDEYCARNDIETIDFLKVDVEGAEPKVFAGFSRMLTEKRVRLVQFEYNAINIESRYLLLDFYRFFEAYGFTVGKLFPRGVSFGPYDFREEDFTGPNYVAIHESEGQIRKLLEYHPKRSPYVSPFG